MNKFSETSDQYRQIQIETSSSLDLVILAYEALIRNLYQALEALSTNPASHDVFNESLSKSQQIVSALDDGIDDSQGELASTLADLYQFARAKLIESNMDKDVEKLKALIATLEQVKVFWEDSRAIPDEDMVNESIQSEKKVTVDIAR